MVPQATKIVFVLDSFHKSAPKFLSLSKILSPGTVCIDGMSLKVAVCAIKVVISAAWTDMFCVDL